MPTFPKVKIPKYVVLEKRVGQTPLEVVEGYKSENPQLAHLPMAYAGRLDPMASGKLLVLIGEECKNQEKYHTFDKAYRFEVLLGSSSDTGDILGLVDWNSQTNLDKKDLVRVADSLVGPLSLPYPKFSSRTVRGKPLHMWTLENRLNEIEIPTAKTNVYKLKLTELRTESAALVYKNALKRIESIAPVTEESKALGRDFRRQDVRVAWQVWHEHHRQSEIQIATFECVASSGTYMRSLSEELARRLGTTGLAYSIHRSAIGRYRPLPLGLGLWTKKFN